MSEHNPWKRLSRREVYDNPWIHVDEDRVINPGGGLNLYGCIHFKNLAIGIIPLDEDGNTWLVGQYRYVPDAYFWEIPMGGSPCGQEPLEGAKRELKEETGLSAERWSCLMRLHTSNSVTDEEGFVFLAEGLTQGETEFEETEDLAIRKLPLEEAVRMVMDGEITDAISVAGLLKLALLRGIAPSLETSRS
ncbi:NUDIX domain-containing protein [Methyloterricola oryzae]|uniref:NUDIX domain-containing protein n=1 Tax=Methyloterricola oryzae TaxID=1495050 RepID=UPI0005EB2BBA|nr:NUDIX hydrolase [Methyloterricola oryzae]